MRRQALVFRINALAGTQSYAGLGLDRRRGLRRRRRRERPHEQSISSETDYDPWPEIERQTAALAGPGTVVAAAPSIASLLVSGPPRDIRRVRAYLAWLNREVLRPVTLLVHVYSVTGDPATFALDDCATQRNLDAQGREQARKIGAAIRAAGVTIDRVLTSQWCRCRDTARFFDLGHRDLQAQECPHLACPQGHTRRAPNRRKSFARSEPIPLPEASGK